MAAVLTIGNLAYSRRRVSFVPRAPGPAGGAFCYSSNGARKNPFTSGVCVNLPSSSPPRPRLFTWLVHLYLPRLEMGGDWCPRRLVLKACALPDVSQAGAPCAYLVNPCNWRLVSRSMSVRARIETTAEYLVRVFVGRGVAGVETGRATQTRRHYVVHLLAEDQTIARPRPLSFAGVHNPPKLCGLSLVYPRTL